MSEVRIELANPMQIRIESDDYTYLAVMKERFTCYVEGFQYMPQTPNSAEPVSNQLLNISKVLSY